MKEAWILMVIMGIIFIIGTFGFPPKKYQDEVFQRFPINTLAVYQHPNQAPGMTLAPNIVTTDGLGAIQLNARKETHFVLVTLKNPDLKYAGREGVRLIYQAKLKTRDLNGQALLEMQAQYPNNKQTQTQSILAGIDENTGWTTLRVPFYFQKDRPRVLKLGVVLEGAGTAWVEDIKLLQTPLKP